MIVDYGRVAGTFGSLFYGRVAGAFSGNRPMVDTLDNIKASVRCRIGLSRSVSKFYSKIVVEVQIHTQHHGFPMDKNSLSLFITDCIFIRNLI